MATPTLNQQLFEAIEQVNLPLIRDTIAAGADVNACNVKGYTPLTLSCTHIQMRNAGRLVNCLLDLDANINLCDARGYTPLFIAVLAKRPGVVQTLLERGANPNVNFFPNHTPKVVSSALDLVYRRYLTAIIREKKGIYDDFELLQCEIDGCRSLMLLLTEAGARQYQKEVVPEYS